MAIKIILKNQNPQTMEQALRKLRPYLKKTKHLIKQHINRQLKIKSPKNLKK